MRTIDLLGCTVTVARGALDALGDLVARAAPAHRCVLITDEHVGPLYAARARAALGATPVTVLAIPPGEAQKTRARWAELTDAMLAAGCGRDTTVLALGGGVVGDLAGFVAATFMRGVPVVQVPTTLLAMMDASIGGKTGVDTPAGKNLVGAFHQPAAVVVDPDVLDTLPASQLRAGMAEAIKHGVIADADYFAALDDALPALLADVRHPAMVDVIARGIAIKCDVVRRDEREAGVRKILNFGHTLGHAIETESDYRLLHGEAVAIGMVLEGALAERVGAAEPGTAARVEAAVRRAALPGTLPRDMAPARILARTRGDKKARAGIAEYTLPRRIGEMTGAASGWSIRVSDDDVMAVLA